MRKVILPALVVGAITLAAQATISISKSTDATGAGWFLLYEGSVAKLAYGLPDSDQVALMLVCSPGDRVASVYGDVEPDLPSLRPANIGPTPLDPLSQGEAWDMTLSLEDEQLWQLASNGQLPVRSETGAHSIRANQAEQALVRQFLGYCATRHA